MPWLALPIVVLLPPLVSSGDWDATLAGFLAIGITLAGALAFGRSWWPAFMLIAVAVLLAPDAYTAFGLIFDLAALLVLAGALFRRSMPSPRAYARRSGAHTWK